MLQEKFKHQSQRQPSSINILANSILLQILKIRAMLYIFCGDVWAVQRLMMISHKAKNKKLQYISLRLSRLILALLSLSWHEGPNNMPVSTASLNFCNYMSMVLQQMLEKKLPNGVTAKKFHRHTQTTWTLICRSTYWFTILQIMKIRAVLSILWGDAWTVQGEAEGLQFSAVACTQCTYCTVFTVTYHARWC